jgi:hypothetical protein
MENTHNKMIPICYIGVVDILKEKGISTGTEYIFRKDSKRIPLPTKVKEQDAKEILEKRKQNCKCSHPRRIFFTKDEFDKAVAGEIDLMKL